jgi:hypothetical protein
MPTKWVPPGTFMRLDRDTVVYYAYKDGSANNVLLYHYNMSYYEEEDEQFDVRDLISKLEKAGLSVADEKKLQICIEQSKHDNGTRGWHRGLIRLAWRHKLLPREGA